ncbi:hypothetical protein C7S16_2216 [Burkholderia thailandensis]|uniref:Uncharacterized protein n=1 Tax=Burkholderia thailandensis TaxID=57975 RepID=A0AAW9D688_BURTH|nr:hypothetical protein [Burkholderia thailandensis]
MKRSSRVERAADSRPIGQPRRASRITRRAHALRAACAA